MIKKILLSSLLIVFLVLAVLFINGHKTLAFNGNNLMDDGIFDNSSTMDAGAIDFWLNNYFPNSCISTNHGFSAPDPTGYSPSTGYTYGGNVSAGKVIYDAAQAYELNPQVILATIQKEESLVVGDAGCSTLRYSAALGYGCPDGGTSYSYSGVNLYSINGNPVTSVSGTCVNSASKVGFSQQVIHAAWLLKFGEQRSEGNVNWAIIKGSWDNSDDPQSCYGGPMTQGYRKRCASDSNTVYYDGFITIDGISTHMDNGTTAALYWYTPHFHGNQNFDDIFQAWFGSIYVPQYAAQPIWQQLYANSSKTAAIGWGGNFLTGQSAWAVIAMKNVGNVTWTKSGGPGTSDIRAATYPWGRQSAFCPSNWLINCTRPATMNEASVAPGQTGTFEFPIITPSQPGAYNEGFGLVVDGKSTLGGAMNFQINVFTPSYSAQAVWQQIYTDSTKTTSKGWGTTMNPGETAYAVVAMKNTSNFVWSRSGGTFDVRLATYGPWGKQSAFCPGNWLINCSRPTQMVENSVAPGQTATFEFPIKAPTPMQQYNEAFGLVVDGKSVFNSGFMNFQINVVPPTAQAVWQQIYTDSGGAPGTALGWGPPLSSNLVHGQKYWATVVMKNTSSLTWTKNGGGSDVRLATFNPWGRQSIFCSNPNGSVSWIINCTRAAVFSEASVAPGANGTFTFPLIAPQAGTYNEGFGLVIDGKTTFSSGFMNFKLVVN